MRRLAWTLSRPANRAVRFAVPGWIGARGGAMGAPLLELALWRKVGRTGPRQQSVGSDYRWPAGDVRRVRVADWIDSIYLFAFVKVSVRPAPPEVESNRCAGTRAVSRALISGLWERSLQPASWLASIPADFALAVRRLRKYPRASLCRHPNHARHLAVSVISATGDSRGAGRRTHRRIQRRWNRGYLPLTYF